jgi:hypothetical protein
MIPKVTAEMVEECLAEMTPEGQAGIEDLVEVMRWNYQDLPRHKQLGRKMTLELIGCLLFFLRRPRHEQFWALLKEYD